MLDEERRRRAAGAQLGVRDEPAEERQVRVHALDDRLRERGREPVERVLPRRAVRDQLREHRVVPEGDLVSLRDARVDADRLRQHESRDASALRQERPRILRVQAHLDGVAL